MQRAIQLCSSIFIPLALAFLLLVVYENQEFLRDRVTGRNNAGFYVSILLWLLLHFLHPATVIAALQGRFSVKHYSVCLKIHMGQLPARYLPGGIWHTAARFAHYYKLGVTRGELIFLVAAENIFAINVTLGIGSFLLVFIQPNMGHAIYFPALCILISSSMIFLQKLGSRNEFPLSSKKLVLNILAQLLYWTIATCSFMAYCYAMFPDSSLDPLKTASAYLISWGIGFIAFFAPQGIGIFEFTAGAILHEDMALSEIAALLLGFRIVVLIADILGWILNLVGWRFAFKRPTF